MLTVTVIAVGKIKEKYFTDAISEYSKRLGRYCKLNIIELKDESTPDSPTDKERDAVLKKEGERISEKINPSSYVVALCIEGKMRDSVGFSKLLEQTAVDGKSEIVFVIGGSLGIHEDIKKRADFKLSFSEMTFPHQLMRVVLLEQIYRGFNISGGGKYHK